MLTAHIINHTHWDREWFLTSVYTSRWVGGLIDRLKKLAEINPDFRYFLDGQTLVIEDLLQLDPQYREKVEQLVRDGNLTVGPYYCQPDWRLTGGEALLRNFLWGRKDMQQIGAGLRPAPISDAGWLVDTFGHISQSPQLHSLFGIEAIYIWRGAPQLEPYFYWQGADGTRIFTINLFGGYRNLYGVTHAPEVAAKRLQAETSRLQPYYPTADIPLFDGYDLEDNPEDPVRFFQNRQDELPQEIQIREATPASYAREIQERPHEKLVISGELISGKFGAVFPGTLSTRTYLKVMARDCEYLLYQVCEPLAAMAWLRGRPYGEERYEAWSRILLQNAVHDCICGVSIDQVHEKMEFSYRQAFESILADIQESLPYVLQDFSPGDYAISTNPFPYEGYAILHEKLCRIQTHGIGVWQIAESISVQNIEEPVESFVWKNPHYEALINQDGHVLIGNAILGALLVHEERGDAYSEEIGPFLGALKPTGALILEQKSDYHCVLRLDCSVAWEKREVSARLRLTFDQSPMVRWQIELDPHGTDFRVEIAFETGQRGKVSAGMPFDVVQRSTVDRDHLPRRLEENLESVLLGQRELGATRTFPFHDFVAISNVSSSAMVLAKGNHAYQADEQGRITITLLRAIEWLTKPSLENRVGDAGPFFYVPDARCERKVTFELAVAFLGIGVEDFQWQAMSAGFQKPPLIVESNAKGARTHWQLFQEDLPLSSLHVARDGVFARVWNPSPRPRRLTQPALQADGFGQLQGEVSAVPPKRILTLALPWQTGPTGNSPNFESRWVNPPAWRVGHNQGLPERAIIGGLKEKVALLEQQIQATDAELAESSMEEGYRIQHQRYVLQRELLEYRLSIRLNEIKLGMQGNISHDSLYEPDEEIAAIGQELNQLRIKRRIYDYVVQAL